MQEKKDYFRIILPWLPAVIAASVFNTWWGRSFPTPSACISNINGSCKWGSGDSFACLMALGPHGAHTMFGSPPMGNYMKGSGTINFLNADGVDKADGNHFYFRGYWTPYGLVQEVVDRPVSLQKSINASQACIDQIKGNAMYSLAGAKYEISVNGQVVETLVTDQDGKAASAQKYKVGTVLTIREIAAPAGFKLDTTVYTHKVTASDNLIAVKDEPIFDPPFAITKVDRDTTKPQGNGSFSGAVFKWEYFDNTGWSGTPKRTWYFQTDADGWVYYDSSYLAPGYASDALYVTSQGTYEIPLGTVKITEVKNSLGYIVLPKSLYCSIVADPTSSHGAKHVWEPESQDFILDMIDGNYGVYEPVDTSAFGSLIIQKLDKDFGAAAPTWATLAGCEFTVYNRSANAVKIGDAIVKPGEVCCTLTVDSTGKSSTGNIFPIGSYEVRESKGNDYYQCNEEWSYTFTVTGEEAHQAFTGECADTMYPGAIHLQKFGTDGKPMPGAKFLLEWSTDGSSWTPVAKSADIVMGGCSSPELDGNGCLTIGADGTADFTGLYPAVQYRITEVEAPNGYQLLKEPILVPELLPEKNFECAYRVVNNDMFTLPKTGLSGTWMYGVAGIALMAIGCAPVLLATRRKRYRE